MTREKEVLDDIVAEENINTEDTSSEESKPLANVLDLLLATDRSRFKIGKKRLEITRLSELFGGKFVIELRIIPNSVIDRIEKATNQVGFDEDGQPQVDINTEAEIVKTLVEAVYTLEGEQLFKKAELRRHFNVKTNDDLVRVMLSPGERKKLHDRYKKLAGFEKVSIKDIKN